METSKETRVLAPHVAGSFPEKPDPRQGRRFELGQPSI
jgi:hypothetical protein